MVHSGWCAAFSLKKKKIKKKGRGASTQASSQSNAVRTRKNMNRPPGRGILFQILDMREAARSRGKKKKKKVLSPLISAVPHRRRGNSWYFMHSQFRWSSSPPRPSVAQRWQHHYCLPEHSGDVALVCPWPDEMGAIRKAAEAVIALSASRSDFQNLCAAVSL